MSLAFTLLLDAAVLLAAAAFAGFLLLLSRGAGWAWEHRPDRRPTRLDRVLAQCEREREELAAMQDAAKALFREAIVQARADDVADDPALWESMERRAEQ